MILFVEFQPRREGDSELDAELAFECTRKRGAVLSLPVSTRRLDTLARGEFEKWIVNHIDSWFRFMQDLGLGIEHMEDIVLVTGCHRTRSYTNAIFTESQHGARVSFGVRVGGSGSGVEWRSSREQIGGVLVNCGPSGNVCLFISQQATTTSHCTPMGLGSS
jgi:hypothetical protein